MIDGKFYIELAGQQRELAANFGFVEAIERSDIKKPIVVLLDEALQGKFNISDIVSVFYQGLRANRDTRLDRAAVGEEILKFGVVKFIQLYIEFLTFAISGSTELKAVDADEKKNN